MIAIINYGSGNIRAIGNIYDNLKIPYEIINKPNNLSNFSKVILPGVGAFDESMSRLNDSGFKDELNKVALIEQKPVLGICVGMQILANRSEEGVLPGLGWVPGSVKKFDKYLIPNKPKIPHLGWNTINVQKSYKIFENIVNEEGFYFIHSYYFECFIEDNILATTNYGIDFTSSIVKGNIFGVQFHPEKSHRNGIQLLKNFAEL
jgi:glutamine amidotransferase